MYFKTADYKTKYADMMQVDNFRDLGGIVVDDGRKIKDGMFFRCGKLFDLTEQTKDALQKLNVKHVFDLRTNEEAEHEPDFVPQGATYHLAPVVPDGVRVMVRVDEIKKLIRSFSIREGIKMGRTMPNLYTKMPFGNSAYQQIFDALDTGESILFHCTAGKDRTGVASMLILLAFGLDYQAIRDDYMLSETYRKEANLRLAEEFKDMALYPIIKPFVYKCIRCKEKYIKRSYNEIFKRYKTVEEFFLKEYGVDKQRIQRWKDLYTE